VLSDTSERCEDECIDNICQKRSLYSTNDAYQYFTGQLSVEHFFDLYTDLCGISVYDDECTLEWNLLRKYLGNGYNHCDIITSDLFVEKAVMRYLRVEIMLGEELDELDFRTDQEKCTCLLFLLYKTTVAHGQDISKVCFPISRTRTILFSLDPFENLIHPALRRTLFQHVDSA
jgi:hypothetical protein